MPRLSAQKKSTAPTALWITVPALALLMATTGMALLMTTPAMAQTAPATQAAPASATAAPPARPLDLPPLKLAPELSPLPAPAPAVPMAAPAAVPNIPVRIGQHDAYTRIVFDLPKLAAYNAAINGDTLTLTIDTQSPIDATRFSSPLVKSVRNTGPGQVTITAAAGASFKHYRLLKKVVIDVSPKKKPPAPATAADKKPAPAPVEAASKTEETKTAHASVATAKAPTPALAPAPAVKTPAVAKAPVTAVEQAALGTPPGDDDLTDEADTTPTTMTISTLEPVKIAVFSRFDTLWVVLDSSAAGVTTPKVSGPRAGLLGEAQTLKFDGGTAYRYHMPEGTHVGVDKKNGDWLITVSPKIVQPLSSNQPNIQFDDVSKKAKIIVPLKGAGKVLNIEDPAAGDKLLVLASDSAEQRVDQSRRFADIEILPAAIGLAVHPLADDIAVNRIQDFALIAAPTGILATPQTAAGPTLIATSDTTAPADRLFDFPNWRQGGIAHLNENREALLQQIAAASTPVIRNELLRKLALLYFANNFGHETLSILRMIEQDDPEAARNPNFIALRGVAHAMAGRYPEAMQDFSNPAIQQHGEVKLWTGYVAAATEQWTKANESFPSDNRLLAQYPDNLSVPMTVYMAESALRLGRTDTAKTLLGTLDNLTDSSSPHYQAAIQYLKGEIARQEGHPDEAIRLWRPIADGMDRLFHTKASFALANLELQEKKIELPEAIDRVDSLRFAWRGDGLEVAIFHNLGLLKVQSGKYLEGLEDIKNAAELAETLHEDSSRIREDLTRLFMDIFNGDAPAKITPLEAVSVYNAFSDLIPRDTSGSETMLKVADAMISIDLLGKAEAILEQQVDSGLIPPDMLGQTGAKLAAIYLLDGQPAQALAAIEKTVPATTPSAALHDERELLRARALSQTNKTDDAIRALSALDSADAHKLKADVYWRARRWSEAAAAIETVLPAPEGAKLTPEEAQLVVNAAVGYKLAGDSANLQSLRSRYSTAMASTALAATFGVVTRESGSASLADRNTILNIAGEVDMFKGFLDSYKATGKGS